MEKAGSVAVDLQPSAISQMTTSATTSYSSTRLHLDRLLAADAVLSVVFGVLALTMSHRTFQDLTGGSYHHAVHEVVRLYACLRVTGGWILWHIRGVDDGRFRRHVCEAQLVCYVLQALTVLRAQFTSPEHRWGHWIVILVLLTLSVAYGSFRFGKGGHLIKIYELPTASTLA